MKWVWIVLVGVLVLFFSFQLFWQKTTYETEKLPFKTIEQFEGISVRQYDARLFLSVKMNSNDYNKSSSEGFGVLAGYIFGGNSTNEKIPMTSPVSISLEENMTMMFMVPNNYSMDDLPTPNDANIKFKEESSKKVAVISFGGWANAEKIQEYKNKLVLALKGKGIPHTTNFYFLGSNPPFEVFNRRNEVIVELHQEYKPN